MLSAGTFAAEGLRRMKSGVVLTQGGRVGAASIPPSCGPFGFFRPFCSLFGIELLGGARFRIGSN